MDRVKRGVGKFTGRALVDGEVVCETTMMCALHKAKEEGRRQKEAMPASGT